MARAPAQTSVRTLRVLAVLWTLVPLSCRRGAAQPATLPRGAAQTCPTFEVQRAGTVEDEAIQETSGIAAATTLPGALWVHNDSGDAPRLYALSRQGKRLGAVVVEGAEAVDWEDMAAAPGQLDGARDLLIGDVGDNFARRETVQLYRLPEPAATQLGGSVRAVRYELRLPEGARDVEALFVDPRDGAAYLVQKSPVGGASVYRATLDSPEPRVQPVARVGMRMVTAADMSPDGSRLVLRNYRRAFLYERAPGQSVAELLATEPCPVTLPKEPQGEAIAFADAHTLLSLSEKSGQSVYVLRERPRGGALRSKEIR